MLNLPAFTWLYSAHDAAIHTARRYGRAEVAAKLRRAGLRPVRVRYWNWLLFPPLAIVRLLRRWLGKTPSRPSPTSPQAATAVHSDLVESPRWLNAVLDVLLALEAQLSWIPVPAGLSVIAVARTQAAGDGRCGSAGPRADSRQKRGGQEGS